MVFIKRQYLRFSQMVLRPHKWKHVSNFAVKISVDVGSRPARRRCISKEALSEEIAINAMAALEHTDIYYLRLKLLNRKRIRRKHIFFKKRLLNYMLQPNLKHYIM